MKFESPATDNPIDQLKVVGKPTDRIEGRLKTTGTATYAHEWKDFETPPAFGVVLGSAIAKGKIRLMDFRAAKSAQGVLAIVTAENAGEIGQGQYNTARLLGGPDIQHYHQAIALVVADTFERARDAAQLIRIDYEEAKGQFDLAAQKERAADPGKVMEAPTDTSEGDFAGAFERASVKLDETYTTPDQAHAMMEPHASIASWEGDKLSLWTANQMIDWSVGDMAKTLGIPKANVRLRSPYIGGGFGGKLFIRADALLAALGAKAVGRPVKVALARPLMFNNTTHRAATIQRIRLGADADGKITAIGHESWTGNLEDGRPEAVVLSTRVTYASANRMTATRLATLDLPESNAMRAPGDAQGSMAMEIAIDELAEKLRIDPVELRIINDTQVDPAKPERKFSERRLVECLRRGADRFGWSERTEPGRRRDGRWLRGIGVAAAYRENPVMRSGARVRLDERGVVTVETDMTDIGTGSYTIIAQTAAEMMGVPLDRVDVRLGDSAFPVSAGSGGQWGANSSTAGVYAACVKLREAVAQRLGFNAADVQFADGGIRSGNRSMPIAEAAKAGELSAEDAIEFVDLHKKYEQMTFGAHFSEVGVDVATGEVRVRRMLAVCSSGRILNPKTARSQVIGAMTMGIGAALMEHLVVDKARGFFVNHDLASYEVPVHADVPHQDVIFLDGADPISSPMKAKGVGELGICGSGAAVANAIYNATGVRVRDYPMTLDKYLQRLPSLG